MFNTTVPSKSFVCGSECMTHKLSNNEKKNKGFEVLNNSKAEKSLIMSSVIDFVSADVEGQSAKQNCKSQTAHGDTKVY